VERQTGIAISYEKQGEPYPVDGGAGVHVYRVVQEALNNVARHSTAKQAWVRLRFLPRTLELEVEDHGTGFPERPSKRGIGLVAMRERSELMGGQITFTRPPDGGTLVHLTVPREKAEFYGKEDHSIARG
jgi:signal transduction histidine kinase